MTAEKPIGATMTPEADRSDAHSDDLRIFLDIVELVNLHRDEQELIEAVLLRLDRMKASAGIVYRRLEPVTNKLIPCPLRDTEANPNGLFANAVPALRELLNSTVLDLEDSFEGYALKTNTAHKVSNRRFSPINGTEDVKIELSNDYREVLARSMSLNCAEGLFLPVHATSPIGTLVLYSIGDVVVDDRRSQLLERSAQVLAFGIEKCRALDQVDAQREALQASNDRLAESNRDLNDFAYVASHDLQEPLRKIQAFGDRLESKAGDRLSRASFENLQRMRGASQQMQLLIHDLLRYSRVASSTLEVAPADLGRLIKMAAESHAKELADSGGTITVSDEMPTVEVDFDQFLQVFDTLLGNAIKYRCPQKPLVVEFSCDDAHPDLHQITCRDNGVGFEQKYAERVFEPFKRLHSSAEYQGSGIGLAVCRRILDRSGGKISVESSPGNGSIFSVWLPKQ